MFEKKKVISFCSSLSREKTSNIPWKSIGTFFLWIKPFNNELISFVFQGADYIVETTNVFTTIDECQKHVQADAARRMIIM